MSRDAEAKVMEHLQDLAAVVRDKCVAVARRSYKFVGSQIDDDEYRANSVSACFLAFATLGGDADQPEAFDWGGKRAEMIEYAVRQLRRDLRGKQTYYFDAIMRMTPRKDGASVPQYSWDSWEASEAGSERSRFCLGASPRSRGMSFGGRRSDSDNKIERTQLEGELADLMDALRPHLDPQEFYLITEHYGRGRAQTELANDLVQAEPERYKGAMGEKRARSRIAMAIMRARKKAREHLEPRWMYLMMDAVA